MLKAIVASALLAAVLGGTFESLGVIVRYEKGNRKDLKAFISHFTDPLCRVISEFNVVVNHDAHQEFRLALEEAKAVQDTVPVNFYLCSKEEQLMKFKLSPQSNAQLLYYTSFFINDEQCQDLEEYLALANVRAVSGIFGLIGQVESSTTVQVDLTRTPQDQIFYWDKIEGDHYSMVEDIRLISRHFIELGSSPIREVKEMKAVINYYTEQIFYNFLAAHFYPELKPLASGFPTSVNIAFEEQEEFDYKCVGMRKLINILGYVPVFNQRRNFNKKVWKNPNEEKVIELKKQQLIMEINKGKATRLLQDTKTKDQISSEKPVQAANIENLIIRGLLGVVGLLVIAVAVVLIQTIRIERRSRQTVRSRELPRVNIQ